MSLLGTKKIPLISVPFIKKRLRRITAVSLRNLTLNEFDFIVHFTLHRTENTVAFYTSEQIENQRNPEWTNLIFPKSVQCLQDFIMRVWIISNRNRKLNGENNPTKRLFIEYQIYLNDLKPNEEVRGKKYDRINSLYLEMFGYAFGDSDEINQLQQSSNNKTSTNLISLPSTMLPRYKSYNKESIYRMINVINAIQNEKNSSKICLHSLKKYITTNQIYVEAIKEREARQLKVECVKYHHKIQKHNLDMQKNLQNDKRKKLDEKKIRLEKNISLLHRQKEDLILIDRNIEQAKSILCELNQWIIYRQKQIVAEIAHYIYPISIDSMHEFYIAGLKLPQAEDKVFQSTSGRERDNETISIAINYCCHFVLIISQFIELPLRFPITYNGSNSKIYDYTLLPSEKTNEFPLYIHNDLSAFYYGFFLLNRNIGQIMYHCRILGRNIDYRKTLENLKDLIDHYFSLPANFKIHPYIRQSIQPLIYRCDSLTETPIFPKLKYDKSNSLTSTRSSISYTFESVTNNSDQNLSILTPSTTIIQSDDGEDEIDLFPAPNKKSDYFQTLKLTIEEQQQTEQKQTKSSSS